MDCNMRIASCAKSKLIFENHKNNNLCFERIADIVQKGKEINILT